MVAGLLLRIGFHVLEGKCSWTELFWAVWCEQWQGTTLVVVAAQVDGRPTCPECFVRRGEADSSPKHEEALSEV